MHMMASSAAEAQYYFLARYTTTAIHHGAEYEFCGTLIEVLGKVYIRSQMYHDVMGSR